MDKEKKWLTITNMTIIRNDPATGCTRCTELRFVLSSAEGPDSIICSTAIDIQANITTRSYSPGIKRIRVEAIQDFVFLNMTA